LTQYEGSHALAEHTKKTETDLVELKASFHANKEALIKTILATVADCKPTPHINAKGN
jgi:hypothetical protein